MINSTFLALNVALALTALVLNTKLVVSTSDFVFLDHVCSSTSLQTDTSYTTNVNTVLSDLVSNANKSTNNGYYATNTSALGRGLTYSEVIYACYVCRGDIPSTECSGCVSVAVSDTAPIVIAECPMATWAVFWYDKCMVRYATESFFGTVDEFSYRAWANQENVTSDVKSYTTTAGNTLQGLASLLGSSPPSNLLGDKKYYRIQVAPVKDSFVKLYTMAQCTPDLAPSDCRRCLEVIIGEIPTACGNSKGCRMLNPSCMVRYEGYNFYDSPVASPPAASPPAPSSLAPISGTNLTTLPIPTPPAGCPTKRFRNRGEEII